MEYPFTTAAFQLDLEGTTQLLLLAIFGIAIIGLLYHFFYRQPDNAQDDTRVAVKIDRKGNYRYERIPDDSGESMAVWWRILIVLIALALLFIPLNSLLNRT